jgi:outer membrane receptor protein involved in Fe transport
VLQGQVARNIHTYAAGLLDILGSANKSVQFFDMTTREWQYGLYFRDRWQVNRNFTLNLGARYEYYPLMTRGDGRGIERWDPATNLVTIGGVGNVPKNNGMTTSKKLFAPRVGFAWRLTKTPWSARATASPSTRWWSRGRCAACTRPPSGELGGAHAVRLLRHAQPGHSRRAHAGHQHG